MKSVTANVIGGDSGGVADLCVAQRDGVIRLVRGTLTIEIVQELTLFRMELGDGRQSLKKALMILEPYMQLTVMLCEDSISRHITKQSSVEMAQPHYIYSEQTRRRKGEPGVSSVGLTGHVGT